MITDQEYRERRNAYMRNYMKERKETTFNLVIKPTSHSMLRNCYKEYVAKCQQSKYIPVKFNEFIVNFAEIGFLEWRKGK